MAFPLKIAINAQIIPGGDSGGVEQVVIGLVQALGQLDDGDEEYMLVTHPRAPDWLKPYFGPNQRMVTRPWHNRLEWAKARIQPLKPMLRSVWYWARSIRQRYPYGIQGPAQSNGFFESLGVSVIHFPYQSMVLSPIPSIYNPHDVQHLHYPEFFTPGALALREAIYPVACRHAHAVAVASQWVKDDVVRHYAIAPEKIYVIPLAAPTEFCEPISAETLVHVQRKFKLPQTFALYAAQTWPHKNHIRLLEAIALLRDQHDLSVNLVCTGKQNSFWTTIARCMRELRLENQVRFVGYVSSMELRVLYRLAQFTVIPTLFEAGSFPMFEAFREGTPVACSSVTSLPEQAGDAALLFDPTSVESIAEAVRCMATDAELRTTLCQRGSARIQIFTWEKTGRAYRALYRKVAGRQLSDEDEFLLANDWMRTPTST